MASLTLASATQDNLIVKQILTAPMGHRLQVQQIVIVPCHQYIPNVTASGNEVENCICIYLYLFISVYICLYLFIYMVVQIDSSSSGNSLTEMVEPCANGSLWVNTSHKHTH